jgi:tetratricopeptide (TPR) repeat protein
MHWVKFAKSVVVVAAVIHTAIPTRAMESNMQSAVASATDLALTEPAVSSGTMLTKTLTKTTQDVRNSNITSLNFTTTPASQTTIDQYRQSIRELESESGAYASRLWEKNQGLALAYFNEGRHQEAVDEFRRALHIHRINNGLYNVEQIPILQQMIDNHIILENYSTADDHQYYLYRTRLRNFAPDDPQFLNTLREYALWQREAYLLEIGKNGYRRLMSIHNLQSQALALVEQHYGTSDKKLLPILEDLLNTQYLIASHASQPMGDSTKSKYDRTEFDFLRLVSYSRGVDILNKAIDILNANPHSTIQAKAYTAVALGDWYQWHRKRSKAVKMYTYAYQLLSESDAHEEHLKALFDRPKALPATGAFDSQLANTKGKKKGYVTAQFSVTNYGAARKISFLEEETSELQPENYTRKRWRIKKSIKKTLFRPRFENAEPVNTERMVLRYEFYY